MEFNRQSITLLSGIIFLVFGYFIDIKFINISGFILISISLVANIFFKKDSVLIEKETLKENFIFQKKHMALFILLSCPYIINLSIAVTLPSYFNQISDNQLYYLVSLIPYGIGAITGSLLYSKNISKIIFLFIICFLSFCVAIIKPSIISGYLVLFILALVNSSTRVYRNITIMNTYSQEDSHMVFNKIESLCIVIILITSLMSGLITDAINISVSWSVIAIIYILSGATIFSLRNNFKDII